MVVLIFSGVSNWEAGCLATSSSTFFSLNAQKGAFFGNQVKAKKVPTIFIRGTRVSNAFMIQQTFAMSTQLKEVGFASGVIFFFFFWENGGRHENISSLCIPTLASP